MKISLIIPCFNEEGNIKKLYDLIIKELKNIKYELIFINDGSTDSTDQVIKDLYNIDPEKVKEINFSRNFGKESAIYAGLVHSKGDYICIIDADLQQHPKYVIEMIKHLDDNKSIDQVVMVNNNRKYSWFRKKLTKLFYYFINKLSDTNFVENASDFRTFRNNVKDSVLQLSETNRFSKGLFSWVGYNTAYLTYVVNERHSGKSSFTVKKLIEYALDAFISYSTKPIRVITKTGLVISILSFFYAASVIIKKIFHPETLSGYTSVVALVLFFGGIQILFLGIIGEYISKTYIESKRRPIYIAKEKIGFEENDLL